MDRLKDKVALITGAASVPGLGSATAKRFAEEGAIVWLTDIDGAGAEKVAADIRAAGGRAFSAMHNVTSEADWDRVMAAIDAEHHRLDVLVNNAGIAPNGKGFAEMDPESFDRIIAINLTGIYNGIWAFAAEMAERGKGHIVCTSSQAGLTTTVTGVGAYSAAKFGVTAIGEALRTELAPQGVGVTVLFPGYVQTNLAANTQRVGGDIRKYSDVVMPIEVTAADVGEMIAEAIEQDAAYVVTHKNVWPGVETRMAAIKAACDYRLSA